MALRVEGKGYEALAQSRPIKRTQTIFIRCLILPSWLCLKQYKNQPYNPFFQQRTVRQYGDKMMRNIAKLSSAGVAGSKGFIVFYLPLSLKARKLTKSLALTVRGVAQGALIFLVVSSILHHRKSSITEPWSVLPLYDISPRSYSFPHLRLGARGSCCKRQLSISVNSYSFSSRNVLRIGIKSHIRE